MEKNLDVVVIGASGYTGCELLRLLARHPYAKVAGITSEQSSGRPLAEVFPTLRSFYSNGLSFEAIGAEAAVWPTLDKLLKRAQFFFTALPHGTSTPCVAYLIEKGARVVDLSADFRFKNLQTYEEWYGPHQAPNLIKDAVYGLPEFHRAEIKKAKLVATPGCYPTGANFALSPLLKKGLVDLDSLVIDSKSGTSGAGRSAKVEQLFSEVHGGFRPYGVPKHRHTPEIEQELSAMANTAVTVTFTPHLLPIARGILTTAYAKLKNKKTTTVELENVYKDFYKDEPSIRFLGGSGTLPDTHFVAGSYFCDIALRIDERTGRVIVMTAIDNLCRGASGMSVAAMNLMNGWDEGLSLNEVPVFP